MKSWKKFNFFFLVGVWTKTDHTSDKKNKKLVFLEDLK